MATQLSIYQEALRLLGERRLSSLSEDRGPRHELDACYGDVVRECLEEGFWNFAMRTVQIDASDSVEPSFGYTFAFDKPADWVRTFGVYTDERCEYPLERYQDEGDYWYADQDPLYVQFISNGVDYGLDLARWPRSFEKFAASALALTIAPGVKASEGAVEMLTKERKNRLLKARSLDAMNQPVGRPPQGTWVTARNAGFQGRSRWNGRYS